MIKKATEIKRDIDSQDSVLLDWFDMQKPNLCAITKEGVEFIVKAKYTHLHEDDILVCEDGYTIKVSKSEDNIYTLKFSDHITFARIAYEIGNRHQPICIEDFKITILEDISTADIIKACEAIDSVKVEKSKAIFKPNGNAHHSH
ncbi:urease accessory protein UreE [Halarcobacter ebronensis]|uniref:Urease accessory protein UreE n=1 Tax=Halarcobacter ebronensis TaxID=1462615 RepID=A0A4Q1APT0_9BACT|nr:urease accessory protein UreE [Halarcobacter ebronensis]QKF80545.1 urease accessory protein UreE [Halarcobacter ebronensis]RXK08352.1 urease accessory protein UreE [Halarcobacter ebronensis]